VERWIGGNIDLDLSLLPQKYARIMGGMEEEGKAIQSQQWRREKPNSWLDQGGRMGIYTPSKNVTVGATYTGFSGLRQAFSKPRPAISGQIFGQKSGPLLAGSITPVR
jgi:hypothetical protein